MKNLHVPLLKQTKDACGPTSLTMVLRYFGEKISLTQVIKGVGGLKSFGTRVVDLMKYAHTLGYKTYCFSYNGFVAKHGVTIAKPSTELILKYLQRGLPVIVAVRTALLKNKKPSKSGHIIVVTNYQQGYFWFNDPATGTKRRMKESDFLFAWYNNVLDSSAYMLVLELGR